MYRIRTARESDLNDLLAIEQICFTSDKINRRQMRYLLTRAKTANLVAVDTTDQAIGYCIGFTPILQRAARLYSLAVLPAFRGYRIGGSLLNHFLHLIQQQGYRKCTLEVRESDKNTQALYQHFGFVTTKQLSNYYADGEPAQRMCLSLKQTNR